MPTDCSQWDDVGRLTPEPSAGTTALAASVATTMLATAIAVSTLATRLTVALRSTLTVVVTGVTALRRANSL